MKEPKNPDYLCHILDEQQDPVSVAVGNLLTARRCICEEGNIQSYETEVCENP